MLAALARYHAHKQRGTYLLAYFDRTRDDSVLPEARREFTGGLDVWKKLVSLTTGMYPRQMAYGPNDVGHWADKLPYVEHDLQLVAQREDIARRFGPFQAGFDFGGPLKRQVSRSAYSADNYILRNTEAPGFTAIDPESIYSEQTGYGWVSDGPREANAIPLTPIAIARAVAPNPKDLPGDVLYADSIRGRGAQPFAVKLKDGEYRVTLLHPDRSTDVKTLQASNGRLTVTMPEGAWDISGMVIKGPGAPPAWPSPHVTKALRGPSIHHAAPATAKAGTPLTLEVKVSGTPRARTVRLHYRAVNQLTPWKMLEAAPGAAFTIPAQDIQGRWDLMYYFEAIDERQAGWFHPDPLHETPYFVVTVNP